MTEPFLPYGRHHIDDADVAAVTEALRSDYLTTGPRVRAFENAFAQVVGAKFAVACANGTAALHLSALAAGLGPGDAAIVPSVTFLATANAPRYTGADVAFADNDADTALLGPHHLEAALVRAGDSCRAVFPVHMNGQAADVAAIWAIAETRGLTVIEDASHALGSTYRTADGMSHRVGACAHAHMACFSMHPVKTATMGEGGVVTTNDARLHERLCRLRAHGVTRDPDRFELRAEAIAADGRPNPWHYEMAEPGYNYRASDIQCALGTSQLRKLAWFAERRRALARQYDVLLGEFNVPAKPVARVAHCDPVLHLYVLLIDFEALGKPRGQAMRELHARGIGTQVHYLPLHRQPYYARRYGTQEMPGADAYYRRALTVPFFPDMSDADVVRVVRAVRDVLSVPG